MRRVIGLSPIALVVSSSPPSIRSGAAPISSWGRNHAASTESPQLCCSGRRCYSQHVPARVVVPSDYVAMCEDMASRLPEDGTVVTAIEFRSLVEECFPKREYNTFGVYTARQLADNLPAVFKVIPDEETGWYCVGRRVATTATTTGSGDSSNATSSSSSSSTEDDSAKFVVDVKSIPVGSSVLLKDAVPPEARRLPASEVLATIRRQSDVELLTRVRITPRPNARGAHVFVDGDGLVKDLVRSLATVLKLQSVNSTKVVVRQPSSSPHGPTDVVCPSQTQTYQVLETHIDHLLVGAPAVLKDVIILCNEASKGVYTQVAKRYASRMRIFVCTPTTMAKVE